MFLPRANFDIFSNRNPKGNSLLKCMDEIYGCFLSQNTKFPEVVPIHLVKYAYRKMFQLHDGL